MKSRFTALAMIFVSSAATQAASLPANHLVECTAELCGGFAQNEATLYVRSSSITVDETGLVTVRVIGLRNKRSHSIASNRPLELHYGMMLDKIARTVFLGSFTTDDLGNYSGPVIDANGNPYRFLPGSHTGSFVVNDPQFGLSQFMTAL